MPNERDGSGGVWRRWRRWRRRRATPLLQASLGELRRADICLRISASSQMRGHWVASGRSDRWRSAAQILAHAKTLMPHVVVRNERDNNGDGIRRRMRGGLGKGLQEGQDEPCSDAVL